MLATFHVMNIWHPYLLGKCFQIKNDHCIVKYFLEQSISSLKQHEWVTKMFINDYKIIYKKGKQNMLAGTLSRKYETEVSLFSLSYIIFDWLNAVHYEWFQHPKISIMIQQLQQDSNTSPRYTWHNDELLYKGHRYLSN